MIDMANELSLNYDKIYNWFREARFKNSQTNGNTFSKEVVEILKKEFEKNNFLNSAEKERIASLTKLSVPQVTRWFQRMRQNIV